MEVDKNLSESITIEKETPRVPIKTYQWEDVRRSRKKGGYPWTHVTKPPFEGEENPEEYTLEAYRRSRSRSTSTVGKARSESASTFGDRSPSPYEVFNHSRTPSTIEVGQHIKDKKVSSTSQPNFETFSSRYERSISPPSKIEKSRSLTRDLPSNRFRRSKSPSRSFSENKNESTKRRSRSPTPKETVNSAITQNQNKMEAEEPKTNGNQEAVIQEQEHRGITNETYTKSDEQINEPLDEISLSPEEVDEPNKKVPKDSRSRCEEKADSKRKLKRRLSVQSSYSRISLTKQSILDRIKSTKKSFRAPKMVKRSKSDVTHQKKPINTKGRKSIDTTRYADKPVYIHIPLKPPPGKTDEFSYLEFEKNPPPVGQPTEKKNGRKEVFGDHRDGSPIVGVILEYEGSDSDYSSKGINDIISKIGNGASVQQIDAKDLFPDISEQSAKIKEIVDSVEDNARIVATDGKDVLEEVEVNNKQDVLKKLQEFENGSIKEDQLSQGASIIDDDSAQKDTSKNTPQVKVEHTDTLQIQELSSREGSASPSLNKQSPEGLLRKPIITEPDEDNISQYLDRDEPIEVESSRTESAEPEEAGEKSQKLKGSDLDIPSNNKPRARSEEPAGRKRKLSIDSSYSRKSLSKLAFLKKFKNFTEKIKFPAFKKAEDKDNLKEENKKNENRKQKVKDPFKSTKKEEPQIIYIPLKPPEGETDEFSKFADEPPPSASSESTKKELARGDTETSEETPTNDVQIIILTPPSDDEILDASIPETPSETDQKFFDNMQIDNLKHLAKKVVDAVYPDSDLLQTVQEEKSNSEENLSKENDDKQNKEKNVSEPEKPEEHKNTETSLEPEIENSEDTNDVIILEESILVDEEDGLKLSEVAVAMIKEELGKKSSSNVALPEGVTKVKKKVLFKNKKKTDDGEYEYISIPDSQRSSIIEHTEDAQDPCKIKEDVELINKKDEEGSSRIDGQKWSELDDHEYEPINPPPEEMAKNVPPQIQITSPQRHESALSSTTSLEKQCLRTTSLDEDLSTRKTDIQDAALTSEQLQQEIEDRYFNNPSETTTPGLTTSQVDSSTIQSPQFQNESAKKKDEEKAEEKQGGRFNEAFKHQADAIKAQAGKIKLKFQNIKKPNLSMPQKPKFQTPSFKMPKLGDRSKIHMPTFKKNTEKKNTWQQQRQISTESNVGEPKKHFDFSTFPKLFDRSKKGRKGSLDDFDTTAPPTNENKPVPEVPEFSTVPRASKRKGPSGSRWANKFKDIEYADTENKENIQQEENPIAFRISLHEEVDIIPADGSHVRYNEDIDIEEEFERENKEIHRVSPFASEYLKRWEHGEFHEGPSSILESENRRKLLVTDLDEPQTPPELEPPRINGLHSSGSLSDHRHGVIEEIDSDEFFLREKGISQEDIEVGRYLTTEIREAFRNPVNSLSQLERDEILIGESDQSLQEPPPRKKPARKPKRKKTPHVSQENVSFDRDSVTEPEEYHDSDLRSYPPPSRPKRKSKTRKSKMEKENIVPYQETIQADDEDYDKDEPNVQAIELEILNSEIHQNGFNRQMYENEQMQGKEQPEIMISNSEYKLQEHPAPPPRKHKSLKSLNVSEHDSIFEESNGYKDAPLHEMLVYRGEHEYIIPTPEPPMRSRKTQSRSQSQIDDDRTSRGADSIASENLVPVIEEVCVKDVRDSSGYAVIDKQKPRDPPLPPSRFPTTPPRKRKVRSIEKTKVITQTKFFTVPRSQQNAPPPERPHRTYSTLGSPSKPARKKSLSASHIDDKENIDISQYMEIDEEPVKRLQSGEIVQKMKARPLPAPPRPPRRQRDERDVLQDITNGDRLSTGTGEKDLTFDETEVSTQTEPLPDDFVCEPLTQEESDKVIIPTGVKKPDLKQQQQSFEETITHAALVVQPIDNSNILPYSSLREPSSGSERIIPTTKEDVDDETSEIPEDFKKLKSPPVSNLPPQQTATSGEKRPVTPVLDSTAEIELLKTQKLQVGDLDVDKLRVNQLQANKILVSEIEGFSIQVNEINSRSGNLVVSGIELPPHLLQELVDRLQSMTSQHPAGESEVDESVSQVSKSDETLKSQLPVVNEANEETEDPGQKKTPIEYLIDEENILAANMNPVEVPPDVTNPILETESVPEVNNQRSEEPLVEDSEHFQNLENQVQTQEIEESESVPPQRPPRKTSIANTSIVQETELDVTKPPAPSLKCSESASSLQSINESKSTKATKESEIIDQPPPRPPQPEYIQSQPPASFLALRSQPYSDLLAEAIPMPPRRKRHVRATALLQESSSEDNPSPPRRQRSPETSIPHLAGQLTRACAINAESSIRRLITFFSNNVLRNKDGKQDAHVMIIILLVLIAGILLLTGDSKVHIHHHHWEYFNPPRDL